MFAVVWIFYVCPYIALKVPAVQRFMGHKVTEKLSDILGVPVSVGEIKLNWLNNLVIEDLYLPDQNGEEMLRVNKFSAGFDVLPLLNGKIVFSSVRLFGFNANLGKENPSDKLNLQFLIDAFASKDTVKKDTNIDLRISSVLLRRGTFTYNVNSAQETPGKFNANHISVSDISGKIRLRAFQKDSLNASIDKLSFTESSGLKLEKLSLKVIANKDSLSLDDFNIKLPKTDFKIENAKISLEGIKSTEELLNDAPLSLRIPTSIICLKDLTPIVPAFKNFTDKIELNGELNGYINSIDLKHLSLRYPEKMTFVGSMRLDKITNPSEAHIRGEVTQMRITTTGIEAIANNFSDKPVSIPQPLLKLGAIDFTGRITGRLDNLTATGKLSSSAGSLEADINFGKDKTRNIALFLKGNVSTSLLKISELMPDNSPLGDLKMNIKIDANKPVGGGFNGNVNATIDEVAYNGYRYENISLAGQFAPRAFNGKVLMDDANGYVDIEGLLSNKGKYSEFNFKSQVRHLRPDSLNLTRKYTDPDISFDLNADFTGNNIDNLEGNINLRDLAFLTADDSLYMDKFDISASGQNDFRKLSVSSDIINGEVSGAYSFETIIPSLVNTMKNYLPALINTSFKKKKSLENNFELNFRIDNTEHLSNTLKLPFTVVEPLKLSAAYDNSEGRMLLNGDMPRFKVGKSMFEGGYVSISNDTETVRAEVRATNYNQKGLKNYIDVKASAADNRVNTSIGWANSKEKLYKADLDIEATFSENFDENGKNSLFTEIDLSKANVTLNDSSWFVSPTKIYVADGIVNIDHFKASKGDEFIKMNGYISKNPDDMLYLELNKVELSYIFDILNIPVLQFAGKATGTFNINDLYASRRLNTDLFVDGFSFNQVRLGDLKLFSEWDNEQQGIMLLGSIYKNDSTWTDVNGYVYPVGKNSGLSLYFDANDLNIAFLHPFVESIAKNMQGRGFGNVHLHGPFSSLSVEGDAYIMDGGLGVEFLNTYYTFSDSIHLRANNITGNNIIVSDKFGNHGTVNLDVYHNHFRDLRFNVNVKADNMLVYDVPKKQNPLIYGTVFGTGTAGIYGSGKIVNIDVNMRNAEKSDLTLNFMGNSATEYKFITFVDKNELEEEIIVTETDSIKRRVLSFDNDDETEIRIGMLLDVNPTATINIIMDEAAGDKISGQCSGSLQIQYGTKNDLRMYGNMGIVSGNYNFSLQQLIYKDFKIRDGSTISFRGDPFDATMNIDAIYNVTANIQDLDRSFATESARRNIPVNCVLKLDGMLRNPTISFDLELPGSNEELERQVKALVNTEDMLTRQIIYLLVLNKFYTPDYTVNPYASNDFSAVASSALSSQISSLMNSFTDKVQLGTNIRTSQDGIEDTEVEMLLSSQLLNNRLLFNGNFGYKNNATQKNAFIGEFDLEYLLTPSGDIRLKAYNHANDMYMYLKQALTTQGVGVMYKKDFTRFSDIFKRNRSLSIVNRKEDEEKEEKSE